MFTKTFTSDFSFVYYSTLPKWFVYFWVTFCKNSIRISCQIIFVSKHWPPIVNKSQVIASSKNPAKISYGIYGSVLVPF